ncbi:hypothetical protein QA640_31760 [Bradyrhizobium sp. CB82]|uniref:hypothetical protein n=1 Tax=Bradyrhizobium sp. CB82 TaxID=3039159 RepID=UPI0024B1383D|nr:hypothetical protein [Bradyrhizobium sp. CB82]WFU38941.1 hypothetical protein QA640_31760 [Bradyrhizobium sp. CB82]
MVLKCVSFGLAIALVLACSAAMADDYKSDEYLGLDLARAVLSPKRLGPATQFAPVQVEARSDAARAVPDVTPKTVATERVKAPQPRVAHAKSAEPRGAARARLAHRHTNPLDAQAMDTRIQTWPCRSGGICNWKR